MVGVTTWPATGASHFIPSSRLVRGTTTPATSTQNCGTAVWNDLGLLTSAAYRYGAASTMLPT